MYRNYSNLKTETIVWKLKGIENIYLNQDNQQLMIILIKFIGFDSNLKTMIIWKAQPPNINWILIVEQDPAGKPMIFLGHTTLIC